MPKIKEIAEALKNSKKQPSHQKIALALKNAILSGELAGGQRLPSIRNFSELLGVSRSTVHRSFEDLLNQGLLEARHGSATTVRSQISNGNSRATFNQSQSLPGQLIPQSMQKLVTSGGNNTAKLFNSHYLDLSRLTPEARRLIGPLEREFIKLWEQIHNFHAHDMHSPDTQEDLGGNLDLRRCYVDYLRRTRALTKRKEDLFFFANSQSRLEKLLRLTTNPNNLVAIQENLHPTILGILTKANLKIDIIPVDSHGLITDSLREKRKNYSLIYVAPAHQASIGEALSCHRRQELLSIAREMKCLIIEDDTNSELLNGKHKLPCLHFFAQQDQVIYLAQLPEPLQSITQLAAMAVPDSLREQLETEAKNTINTLPWLEQKVLTEIIERGALDKYCSQKRQELTLLRKRVIMPEISSLTAKSNHLHLLASELETLCHYNNVLNLV